MSRALPVTGTAELLDWLADYPPDDFINDIVPRAWTGGRRHGLQASQLWRVHLLALLTSTHSLNLVVAQLSEQSAWRSFARLRRSLPSVRMLHAFRQDVGVGGLRLINRHLLRRMLRRQGVQPHSVALMDATDLPASCNGLRKRHSAYSADRAALGGRTVKTGHTRWYVGYKKHSLRLWLPTHHESVTLLPLVSWVTPANVHESRLLLPSLHWVRRQLGWWPGIVVGDMGYLSADIKRAARLGWNTAVITKLRADVPMQPPYVGPTRVECPQGQELEWWEHDAEESVQWFRAPPEAESCRWCWEAARCPRHFGYPSEEHETFFGAVPLASRLSQRLLQQVRPWIEPAQSFEKNQLGLGQMFFNSLRLTAQMSQWADSAVLLRTMAWLDTPPQRDLLSALRARQLELDLH
jgi:hypothetical protein